MILIAPPLVTYRMLMINEFSYQTYIVHIIGKKGASAIISGESILAQVYFYLTVLWWA